MVFKSEKVRDRKKIVKAIMNAIEMKLSVFISQRSNQDQKPSKASSFFMCMLFSIAFIYIKYEL